MKFDVKSEIWDRLSYFESSYNCKEYLLDRIEHEFYSINIKKLIKISDSVKSDIRFKKLVDFESIEASDIEEKILPKKMAYCFTQAKEYYNAANIVSNNTKPVLLYYGMLSLSKALMDSTIKIPKISVSDLRHGLSIDKTGSHGSPYEQVRIEEQGFFIRFYISYVSQKDYETHLEGYDGHTYFLPPRDFNKMLSYIENKTYFSMKELLYPIVPMHREYNDFYSSPRYGFKKSDLKNCLDEISSNFLMMYILSQLARYKPQTWVDLLKGEKRGEAHLLNRFLKVSETYYPELIYHELTAKASKGLEEY